MLCLIDFSVFVTSFLVVALAPNVFVKAAGSFGLAMGVARLFVLGHDACHQSLFTQREANRWVGRLLFLPSLTPFSTWEAGHNLGHHAYTNLRGKDYVWTPFSKPEFDALPFWRRRLEQFYRSGFGFGAYYLIELWWHKLFFVSRRHIATRRAAHSGNSFLNLGFGLSWIVALAWSAHAMQQSVLFAVLLGFVVPLLMFGWLMGFAIYLHHTHPRLVWYRDIDLWEASRDASCNTVHVRIPHGLGRVFHNIMEHPAHHVDARVPSYNLEAAGNALNMPDQIIEPLSLKSVVKHVAACKLYDFDNRYWRFDGRPACSQAENG